MRPRPHRRHPTDQLARVGQRPVTHGGQEDPPIGCGRTYGIPGTASDVSIQCGVEETRVAEEPEHGPSTRLRGEVGGKPRHRGGRGAVAGADTIRVALYRLQARCSGDCRTVSWGRTRPRQFVGVLKPRTGNRRRGAPAPPRRTRQSRRGATASGRARRVPTRAATIRTRTPAICQARRERRVQDGGSDREHRAVLRDAGGNEQSSHRQVEETANRSSAARTFLNSSRPGYVATRMIGTSPPALRVRRLGGCCKRQHQDRPRRLLQAHHRSEVALNANVTAKDAG